MTTLGKLPQTNIHKDNKQAKGNKNKSEIDSKYYYNCDPGSKYMYKIKEEKDYYNKINKYNKDYDNGKNKEYYGENKEYHNNENGNCETFQGACIGLKGSIFDIGQSLKYKEITEAIYI